VHTKDGMGRTACHNAAALGHLSTVKILVDSSQDSYRPHHLPQGACDGSTALHHASFNGRDRVAEHIVVEHRRRIERQR
jgi:ankyrin repeat protein